MNVLLNVQGIVIHNNHMCLTSKGQGYVIYTKIKKPSNYSTYSYTDEGWLLEKNYYKPNTIIWYRNH